MRELGAHKKREFCLNFRGQTTRVLVEEKVGNNPGSHRGFSRNYLPVLVRAGKQHVNREIDVELDGLDNGWLTGSLTKQNFSVELAPSITANV
jgi:tRNA A37 methylthiotransferase MiaB